MFDNSTGCEKTLSLGITLTPIPDKPAILQSNKTLSSSYDAGNQWFLNGSRLVGDTSKLLTPNKTGSYTVQVTNQNGCLSAISDVVSFVSDDVADFKPFKSINIYPNPTVDFINIESNVPITIYSVELINSIGETIMKPVETTQNKIYQRINVNSLVNGIYLLVLNTDNGFVHEQIIISK